MRTTMPPEAAGATETGDTLVIRIPGRPPTPNARRHWRRVHADNTLWKQRAVTEALLARPFGWQPLDRCTMWVEFIVGTKRNLDLDNLIAAQKPCLDGIVYANVIADDSTRVIVEVTYSVRYVKGESATVYRITPA